MKSLQQEVHSKIIGKIPDVEFGKDYTIEGDTKQAGHIIVKATKDSKWLVDQFEINIVKDAGKHVETAKKSLQKIKSEDVRVEYNMELVKNKILLDVYKIAPEAKLGIDFVIQGDTKEVGKIVVKAVSSSKILKDQFEIKVISLSSKIVKESLKQIKFTPDLRIGADMKQVRAKILDKIHEIAPEAKLNEDFEIKGDTKKEGGILVKAKPNSKFIKDSFKIKVVKPKSWIEKINISHKIDINQVKVEDDLEQIEADVMDAIYALAPDAQLNRDYWISGNTKNKGSIQVQTQESSKWLEGSKTIAVVSRNISIPIDKRVTIRKLHIRTFPIKTKIENIYSWVEEEIHTVAPEAKKDIDYQVIGSTRKPGIIMVRSLPNSQLIKNSFQIPILDVH
ncbi:hypothetical protein [Williamsoniiplasma lucivorax]|uniref:Uncharacterized protein n=1 Tax=Williamsoniiplasma lucivorax TaxID=209274 RepID=A0A2S5RF85_9MOLU|nr:hypothetical protein [Williamsoniiplasma lucivorax]PPE05989.1 hypothetical protein ELUCI_v1c02800 [Williamsoniiplasma lucivorax]